MHRPNVVGETSGDGRCALDPTKAPTADQETDT